MLGTAPTFFLVVGGMRLRMDGSFTPLVGPTCHRVRVLWAPHVIRPLHPHPIGTSSLLTPAGRASHPVASSARPRSICRCRHQPSRSRAQALAPLPPSRIKKLSGSREEREAREGDGRWTERRKRSGAAPSLSREYFVGCRSAPAAPHPNTRGSGSAPLRSRGSPTKHTVTVGNDTYKKIIVDTIKDWDLFRSITNLVTIE
jgi:hypothetical protein